LGNTTLGDDGKKVRGHDKVKNMRTVKRTAISYVKETTMLAAVMLMSVALVGTLCVVVYTLAPFALPVMLGFAAARLAYHTGSGLIGASFIAVVAAVAAFGVFAVLLSTLRSPILRLIVALIFATPAALAGYLLVHGVTYEAIPSAHWRETFCVIGGAFAGVSALLRLASSATADAF
jgi:hypothetical protein